ncbi:MAG: sterol desaturase [Spirochaetaceae bacterium]|nr:sterol desaturase [Spirochaetaceae bacterium]|tara:strand:+ start:62093 stop:63397 length:1305 start_codon:yes stop_codon:yes gene_type:complete
METLELPSFVTYAIPAFFLLILVELLFQWITGKKLYNFSDSITDLSTGVLNRLFTLFYLGLTVAIYSFFYERFRLVEWNLDSTASLWTSAVVGFIAFDFFYYWAHRMSHEMNFLWAGHVVHHQSEEFNLTVALRQPAFHQLFTWIFFIPLAFLGIHPALLVAIGEISLIYQFWIHTRAIDRMGFLESFLNTPSHHRVHHGRNPEYIDKNHGGTLIIWDRIFGTFQRENQEPVYGIVKPFRSYNPLWANLHYWKEILDLARKAPTLSEKILIWFRRPGYDPAAPQEPIIIPEVTKATYRKFQIPVQRSRIIYSLLWFGAINGLVFGWLLLENQLGILEFAGLTGWATFSLICLGWILSGRKGWQFGEAARLVFTSFAAYWVHIQLSHGLWAEISAIHAASWLWPALYILCALSLGWIVSLRFKDSDLYASESPAG